VVARGPVGRRTLVSVDVRGYGSATGRRQASIQQGLVELLDASAAAAGLRRAAWDRQQAGDGEFAVLPADESETALIDDFVRHLAALVNDYNDERKKDARLRLRLALHNGIVERAANGYAGAAAVVVGRLVESAAAKAAQAASPGSGLVVIVSNRVFVDTVLQGHTLLPARAFRKVAVQIKEYSDNAWLYVPGADVRELQLDLEAAATPPSATTDRGRATPEEQQAARRQYHAKVLNEFHAPVTAEVIGIKEGPGK